MLNAMLKQKEAMKPETGFRVVGLDTFEVPGEQLYPISDHPTKAEAEVALAKWKTANPGHEAWVYAATES